jgi:hypothetical protein
MRIGSLQCAAPMRVNARAIHNQLYVDRDPWRYHCVHCKMQVIALKFRSSNCTTVYALPDGMHMRLFPDERISFPVGTCDCFNNMVSEIAMFRNIEQGSNNRMEEMWPGSSGIVYSSPD